MIDSTLLGFIPGVPGYMELIIVLGIALLLFGNRLPGVMRSLGSSIVEFKKGVKEGDDGADADQSRQDAGKSDSQA